MILITGGTSFNVSNFLLKTNESVCIVLNKKQPTIHRDNIKYFKNLSEFKSSKEKNMIKLIYNFASSYNYSNSLFSHFRSSFYFLFKIYRITNKSNLQLIVNIGSYFQDIEIKKFSSYVIVKNFTTFFFTKLFNKTKYINLKLGDTFGKNDTRDKIFKHLKDNKKNKNLVLLGNPNDVFYLLNIFDITKTLNYIYLNLDLFVNSKILNATLFEKQIMLEELISLYEKTANVKFDKKYLSKDITRPSLKILDYDYSFLVSKKTRMLLKEI